MRQARPRLAGIALAAAVAASAVTGCAEGPLGAGADTHTDASTNTDAGADTHTDASTDTGTDADTGAATDAATATDAAAAAVTAAAAATAPPPPPSAPPSPEACADSDSIAIFTSPEIPLPDTPLRVIAVSTKPIDASLAVFGPEGAEAARASDRRGGSPYFWMAEIPAPAAGTYRAVIGSGARADACERVEVTQEPDPKKKRWGAVWPVTEAWGEATENLFSAWIERLFDAPLEEQPTWPALHEVLRDPARNFLHGHLGLREDDAGHGAITIDPDCADLPYFLRAYFAFKMRLPFAFSACTRGHGGTPPKCVRFHTSRETMRGGRRGAAVAFGEFLRVRVADVVHSGNGRVPGTDSKSDYYSVALTPESLRPGTVYADPYGHILMVAKRIPQSATSGGVLLAIDGQPDGTVARRRYWRGNFLFALDPALGGPGFKRFRPVVFEKRRVRALSNDEILKQPGYGDFSLDQYAAGVDGFYDAMDDVLSPAPQSPERVMLETIQALEEQVRGRVLSVQNGQSYVKKASETIEMPEGPAIFETMGAWEDFSTPSRDLRLLIAIDIVRGFPDRVTRRPTRYAMPGGKAPADVKAELSAVLKRELESRRVTYARSDGSPFTLSLADVVARADDLEMAYNPNDCAEVRWGAPPKSEEAKACRRRAPADQRARMKQYRPWFHERRRPPRT